MYVGQVIMLYTWNLHRAICQLYLKKTEKNDGGDGHTTLNVLRRIELFFLKEGRKKR